MNTQQISAYNEMGQQIMDKTGCSSQEAASQIEHLMASMLEALNDGILSDENS